MSAEASISTGSIMRRFVGFFARYKKAVAVMVAAMIAAAALGVVYPLIIRAIVDQTLVCPTGCPDPRKMTGLLAVVVVLVVGETALGFGQAATATKLGERVMADMRQELYERVKSMPLAFFTRTRSGEIQSRLLNDVHAVGTLVTAGVHSAIGNAVIVVSALVAMFILSWQLALVSIYIVPLFAWMSHRVGLLGERKWGEVSLGYERITTMAIESLSLAGVLVSKLFGRERADVERFRDLNDRQAALLTRAEINNQVLRATLSTYLALAPVVVFLVVAVGFGPGTTAGTIVAFTTLQARLFAPVAELFTNAVDFRSANAALGRVFEYLDLHNDITVRSDARALPTVAGSGSVQFVKVDFRYPSAPELAVEGIDLTVQPGQLAAVVGPTGAGKTTLTYLIARLYEVDRGAVLIDGHDVRMLSREALSDAVGLVTQETFLFHASVRENLLYARPDASDDELEAAARAAFIHDQIMQLPEGYDTIAGNYGYRFSGGEKQRLSIARTLLKNPRVLLLDEATSALDSFSERIVQRALTTLMAGRTTIAIAHRLSTIMDADVIYVLDRGRIVEVGTHEDLMAAGKLYSTLHREQFVRPRTGGDAQVYGS